VAFDRAVAIVERTGADGPIDKWRAIRDEIHDTVCTEGYDAEQGAFTQSFGSSELDAAVLLIPLVGFLRADDPRVQSTIEVLRRPLTKDGLVQRYNPQAAEVDGIGEGEGVFFPCSFWMVEALVLAGRSDEAETMFERLLTLANDVGLYAEEYDPVSK